MDSKHCTPPASWQQQNMFTQTCPVPLCLLRSLRRRNRSLWLSSLRRLYRETHYTVVTTKTVRRCWKPASWCQIFLIKREDGSHMVTLFARIFWKNILGERKTHTHIYIYIYVNLCFYWESTCVGFLSFTFLYPMRLLQPHLATLPISLEELGRNNFRNPQHPQTTVKTAVGLAKLLEIFSATLVAKLRLEKGSADVKTAGLSHPWRHKIDTSIYMPVSLLFWTLRTQHKMPMPSLSCVFPFFLGPP